MRFALALLACACSVEDPLGTDRSGCAQSPCDPTDRDAYCAGKGPPILVGDGMGNRDICSGAIAQTTFRFALCTHDAYVTSVGLETDSFSAAAGYVTGGRGGSVGIDASFQATAPVTLGGSLWASGISATSLTVAGELRDQGALGSMGTISIDQDAFVANDVDVQDLTVGGTLTLPAASMLTIRGANNAPRVQRAPVMIPVPCDFTNTLYIAGYVAAHATLNHNGTILDKDAYDDFGTDTKTLSLPCGRFYLTQIHGGSFTLMAGGRTALFVGHDIALTGGLTVELAPDAELDLFVAEGLSVGGTVNVGSKDQPNRARMYVGGAVQLGATGTFGGNFYAPDAILQVSADLEIFGSLFVRAVSASAHVKVHYDTDVLGAGNNCPTGNPTTCRTCLDCGNQACIGGVCGQCRTSADCCPPLLCAGGHCSPQVP